MKRNLMLISEKSKHITEVYNVLCRSKLDVVYAENAYTAKAGLFDFSPAFILLDFDIKGADFLLSEIAFGQRFSPPYVIVAASYCSGHDRAFTLKRGADYCVDKPINTDEVLAVIDAVLRRNKSKLIIEYKELTINKSSRAVTMRGKAISLTRKEYEVLCVLANHIGTVISTEEIYRTVWRTSYNSKNTNVSDQISSLRFKLGLCSKDSTYIHTVVGVGYRFGTDA